MDEEKRSYAEGLPEWHDPLFDEKEPEPPHWGDNLPQLSAVFGVVALLFACIGKVSAVMAVLALASGIIARIQRHFKKGLATAGITMGAMALGIQLLLWIMHTMYDSVSFMGSSYFEGLDHIFGA